MPVSSNDDVRDFYDDSAEGYSEMMDAEIKLPLYDEVLSQLAARIANIEGAVLDTSCGSGHMLEKLRDEYTGERKLLGRDLSPQMVALASARLGHSALVSPGDMRALPDVPNASCAAVISYFSLHHIAAEELVSCFQEWYRVLAPRGHLVLATWEGTGAIDYGDHSQIKTQRYQASQLVEALTASGFHIETQSVEPVAGFDMDAVHVTASV